ARMFYPSYYSTPVYGVATDDVVYSGSNPWPGYYNTYQGPEEDEAPTQDLATQDSTKPQSSKPMKQPDPTVPPITPKTGNFGPATALDDDADP
ncbi:MAG: hypothetical protein ACK47R_03995, partial [Planctomycetia bacterium]